MQPTISNLVIFYNGVASISKGRLFFAITSSLMVECFDFRMKNTKGTPLRLDHTKILSLLDRESNSTLKVGLHYRTLLITLV